jgi:predicted GNAT family acetyltransferase
MRNEGQVRPPIINNEVNQRFEVALGDSWAFLEYRWNQDELALTHTEVPDGFRGQGVGGNLVVTALEYARRLDHKIDPQCPFVADFVRNHPEYMELLSARHRSEFELPKSA